ncbi:MAG: hypothetical protein OXC42_05130 [Gammaproteobacteria bacterium]|nr:hypothetical protein [Gammaproteobacteria bacterium]
MNGFTRVLTLDLRVNFCIGCSTLDDWLRSMGSPQALNYNRSPIAGIVSDSTRDKTLIEPFILARE